METTPARNRLRKVVRQRIEHLMRLGQPFTVEDMWDERVRSAAQALTEEDIMPSVIEQVADLPAAQAYMTQIVFRDQLATMRYAGKLWRRWDSGRGSYERKGKCYIYYPGNDRERWHLSEYEQFISVAEKPTKALKEPPLRIISAPVTEAVPASPIEAAVPPSQEAPPAAVDTQVLLEGIASMLLVATKTMEAATQSLQVVTELVSRQKGAA